MGIIDSERRSDIMIKGLILDLDGTILDSKEDIADSMNLVLREEGLAGYDYEAYGSMIGGGLRNLVERTTASEDQAYIDRLYSRLLEVYAARYRQKSRAYAGIYEMLDRLERESIILGINSNKKHEYCLDLVESEFGSYDFIRVLGHSGDFGLKPDPGAALEILDLMDLDRNQVLYIGDSNVDILTGHRAGLKVIAVSWGFRDRKELEEYAADYIVDSPSEIIDIVLSSDL